MEKTTNKEINNKIINDGVKKLYDPFAVGSFLKSLDVAASRIKILLYKFKRYSDKIERPLNQPLYNISAARYLEILSMLENLSHRELKNDISNIRQYTEWAMREDFCPRRHDVRERINIREVDLTRTIKKQIIPDITALKTLCDLIVGGKYIPTIVPIIILLWIGIDKEEITLLKTEDINIEQGVILTKKRDVLIPPLLNEFFSTYKKEENIIAVEQIRTFGEKYVLVKNVSPFYIKYIVGESTAKLYEDKPLKINLISSLSHEAFKKKLINHPEYNNVDTTSIITSGVLYRVHTHGLSEFKRLETPNMTEAQFFDLEALYQQYIKTYKLQK